MRTALDQTYFPRKKMKNRFEKLLVNLIELFKGVEIGQFGQLILATI